MPYYVLDNFGKGVDRRRPEVGALPGTMYVGEDVHVTKGGTIEVRKSFEPKYQLPAGRTKGLARAAGQLYVFGSDDPSVFTGALALPAGINYIQCQHPGGFAMTHVRSYDVFDGKVYCACQYTDGSIYHFYDGDLVTQTFDGRARGYFAILSGTGAGSITSIKVNGVEILGATITWATSHSNFAALLAAQINAYTSSPEYTATSAGAVVYIAAAAGTGAAVNGYVVNITVAGDVTTTTPQALIRGIDNAPDPGPMVKTFGTKMHYLSGSLAAFSGVNRPTQYDENAIGAGAINMANHVSGSEELIGMDEFIGFLAFFGREAIQIWSLSADPELNARVQTINNVGILAGRSTVGYGEADLAFLTESGIRALRPSEVAANYNKHVSISDPIDALLLAELATLSDEVKSEAIGIIEPVDRRMLMAVGNSVYVLSLFGESGIAAWSRYNLGTQITEWLVSGRQLYARSGNTIYLYGGDDYNTYDPAVVPRVKLVNLHAAAPATYKGWRGFDFGLTGEWGINMYSGVDATIPEAVAVLSGSSYAGPTIPVAAEASHVSLEFIGRPSAREIVNIALHYNRHEAD